MDFNWNIFLESWPALLRGCIVTAELSIISIVAGTIIGTLGGVARFSKFKLLSGLMSIYVTIFRAVPMLVTLLFIYYGMPAAGVQLNAFTVAIIALSLTNGAYVTEIVRGGVEFDRSRADAGGLFARDALRASHATHHPAAGASARAGANHE